MDPLVSRVALFALRVSILPLRKISTPGSLILVQDICCGEELSYDYEYLVGSKLSGEGDKVQEVIVQCHCGASNCRGRLI